MGYHFWQKISDDQSVCRDCDEVLSNATIEAMADRSIFPVCPGRRHAYESISSVEYKCSRCGKRLPKRSPKGPQDHCPVSPRTQN